MNAAHRFVSAAFAISFSLTCLCPFILKKSHMTTVEVNKNQYQQHHDYVYDSDEEDEVASLYDLNLYKRQHLKSRRRVRAEAVRSFDSLVDSSVEQNQSIQVECVKCSDDPDNAIEYRFQDLNVLWNNRVHEPNTALIAIEVR